MHPIQFTRGVIRLEKRLPDKVIIVRDSLEGIYKKGEVYDIIGEYEVDETGTKSYIARREGSLKEIILMTKDIKILNYQEIIPLFG